MRGTHLRSCVCDVQTNKFTFNMPTYMPTYTVFGDAMIPYVNPMSVGSLSTDMYVSNSVDEEEDETCSLFVSVLTGNLDMTNAANGDKGADMITPEEYTKIGAKVADDMAATTNGPPTHHLCAALTTDRRLHACPLSHDLPPDAAIHAICPACSSCRAGGVVIFCEEEASQENRAFPDASLPTGDHPMAKVVGAFDTRVKHEPKLDKTDTATGKDRQTRISVATVAGGGGDKWTIGTTSTSKKLLWAQGNIFSSTFKHVGAGKAMVFAEMEVTKGHCKPVKIKYGCAHYPPKPSTTGLKELLKGKADWRGAAADFNLRMDEENLEDASSADLAKGYVDSDAWRVDNEVPVKHQEFFDETYKRAGGPEHNTAEVVKMKCEDNKLSKCNCGVTCDEDPNKKDKCKAGTIRYAPGGCDYVLDSHGGVALGWLDRHAYRIEPVEGNPVTDTRLVKDEILSLQEMGMHSDHVLVYGMYELDVKSHHASLIRRNGQRLG